MTEDKLAHYKTIAPADAKKLQIQLKQQIEISPLNREVKTVAGADISYDRGS